MPNQQVEQLIQELDDQSLAEPLRVTAQTLLSAEAEGHKHWVLAFSGGKDSSAVAMLTVELLKRKILNDVQVDVVYSDTLMELPPFGENALNLLAHIDQIGKQNELPIRTHVAVAEVEQRYWFLVIGKGYPPPHNHFRWCTDRLKIRPARNVMKNLINESSIVLTGVRLGESDSRDGRLRAATCSRNDSECGQGVWIDGDSEMKIPGLAPIIHWRACQVMDLLALADLYWDWPFENLTRLYGDDNATRFGCHMCTLVREDKALIAVTQNPKWRHLAPLSSIRTMLLEEGRKEENRIKQPNGNLGRTSLTFRRSLLNRVIEMQSDISATLITNEEIEAIQEYWQVEEELTSPYNNQCKFWRRQLNVITA